MKAETRTQIVLEMESNIAQRLVAALEGLYATPVATPNGNHAVEPVPRARPMGVVRVANNYEKGAMSRIENLWIHAVAKNPDGVLLKDVVSLGKTNYGTAYLAAQRLASTGKYEYYQDAGIRYKPRGLRVRA